jgi:hypothetical protein
VIARLPVDGIISPDFPTLVWLNGNLAKSLVARASCPMSIASVMLRLNPQESPEQRSDRSPSDLAQPS